MRTRAEEAFPAGGKKWGVRKGKGRSSGRWPVFIRAAALAVAAAVLVPAVPGLSAAGDRAPSAVDRGVAAKRLESLSCFFVPNEGQMEEEVAFAARTGGGFLRVTRGGAVEHVFPVGKGTVRKVTETFLDGRAVRPEGRELLPTRVSSFLGRNAFRWRSALSSWGEVSLGEIYDGVTVRLKAKSGTVEKLITVGPSADPSAIRIGISGGQSLSVTDGGELAIGTCDGTVTLSKPAAYQEIDGERIAVPVSYVLRGGKEMAYGFSLGARDPRFAVVIDPVLRWLELGGSSEDVIFSIAVSPVNGKVYVYGRTNSPDFPGAAGGAQHRPASVRRDAFIACLSGDLSSLHQATYLGGTGDEHPDIERIGSAMAIHPVDGTVYVAGCTESKNFPGTAGGAQPEPAVRDQTNGFVTRLSADLKNLIQASYLGGESGPSRATAVAIHPVDGTVYVAGQTWDSRFFGTAGGAQPDAPGKGDGFIVRLTGDLKGILQASYVGGSDQDAAMAVAIHPGDGSVYVAGFSKSGDLPAAEGAFRTAIGLATMQGFVTRMDAGLTRFYRTACLGGGVAWTEIRCAAVSPFDGTVFVGGLTRIKDNFPGVAGSVQQRSGGERDGFVSRFSDDLSVLHRSTYAGGLGDDELHCLAIRPGDGVVYAGGISISPDFPGTAGGAVPVMNGTYDAFLMGLNPDLATRIGATFVSPSGRDGYCKGVAVHPDGKTVYVCGGSVDEPKTDGLLARVEASLGPSPVLTVTQTGEGTVVSEPPGIDCTGTACRAAFRSGTEVTLTAAAAPGYVLDGWDVDGERKTENPLSVTLTGDRNVKAFFSTSSNPVPVLSLLEPSSAVAGGPSFALKATGSGFVESSTVRWNGSDRPTEFVSGTELLASIPAQDIADIGEVRVMVFTPGPGGGTSEAKAFEILAVPPRPVIETLEPACAMAGSEGFILTVRGRDFYGIGTPGECSVVRWDGEDLPTTYVSSRELAAEISKSRLSEPGTVPVTVYTPGGGESEPLEFKILQRKPPVLDEIVPDWVHPGGDGFRMTVYGSDFSTDSEVRWNGEKRETEYKGAGELQAFIEAGDVAEESKNTVTVFTPGPEGGESKVREFVVTLRNPIPILDILEPSSAVAGGEAFSLTVWGQHFALSSVVRWNDQAALKTEYIHTGKLRAWVPAELIGSAGDAWVTVFTPAPAGGTSNDLEFSITGNGMGPSLDRSRSAASMGVDRLSGELAGESLPDPSPGQSYWDVELNKISPVYRKAGGEGFVLTLRTRNAKDPHTAIRWNKKELPIIEKRSVDEITTFYDVQVSADDIKDPGIADVTVSVPDGNGGEMVSQSLKFYIADENVPILKKVKQEYILKADENYYLMVEACNLLKQEDTNNRTGYVWNGKEGLGIITVSHNTIDTLMALIPFEEFSELETIEFRLRTRVGDAVYDSNSVTIRVLEKNPIPVIRKVFEYNKYPVSSDTNAYYPLCIHGKDFADMAKLEWNGKVLDNELTVVSTDTFDWAVIPPELRRDPGIATVRVVNPEPGGGKSEPMVVHFLAPAPVLEGISPETAARGGAAFELALTGEGFVSTSLVRFGEKVLTPHERTATELKVTVPAGCIAGNGSFEVRVVNPEPGGGTSEPKVLQVMECAPVPVLDGLEPPFAVAGGPSFTLSAQGSSFVSRSAVRWNGETLERTGGNGTRIAATVPAGRIPSAGTVPVTVFTPEACGGTSETKEFKILAVPPRPAIESLKPAFAMAGSEGFVLTVRGHDFYGIGGDGKRSVVRWGGEALPTTCVSSRELTAEISKSRLSEAQTVPVTVYTPGGGESEPVSFEVRMEYPVPTVTKLDPSSKKAGGPQFTLKVEGTGFVGASGSAKGSVVRWNGEDRQTRYESATALAASIPATDVSKPGTATVTVKNGEEKVSNGTVFTIKKSSPDEVPTPVVTGISPSFAVAGDPEVTLSVAGRNFSGDARVLWDGKERKTTRVRSGTELSAVLPASDLAAPGRHLVTVYNPGTAGQSGKTSNGMNFSVREKGGGQAIPTLNAWGMIVLTVLVGAASVLRMRRREGNR